MRPASVSGLAALLSPIPPSLSPSGATGLAVGSLFTRSLSTAVDSSNALEEFSSKLSEAGLSLGATLEASEDLEAILGRVRTIGTNLSSLIEEESSRVDRDSTAIIVDFYASWCGPCRVLGPLLEKEVAANKKTILLKVDVDAAPEIAQKYEVCYLPDYRSPVFLPSRSLRVARWLTPLLALVTKHL